MQIDRRFTAATVSPYEGVAFRETASEIRNPDGSVVFRLEGIEVPAAWSQVASDVLAQKYFRKAGVPARLKKVREKGVPAWLARSVPDDKALAALPEGARIGGEMSAKQVFDRLAGACPGEGSVLFFAILGLFMGRALGFHQLGETELQPMLAALERIAGRSDAKEPA